jgi:hypothetical protein
LQRETEVGLLWMVLAKAKRCIGSGQKTLKLHKWT